jgi:hypothetical protein
MALTDVEIVLQGKVNIPSAAGAKIPKAAIGDDMPSDNVYAYTLLSGDISSLGTSITIIGFMINNSDFPCSYSFSADQGLLTAGDTITFTGLPAKSAVTTINFALI